MDGGRGLNVRHERADSPRSRAEIAASILEASRRRVNKHLTDEDYREVNLGLKDTTEHIAREYHGRVVLELLQNAHDALPKGRSDGRVLVRLDAHDGEFGTLHVANSGTPFNQSNFEALRKVARSDKPPDEAIGNKGIGFKSVLEVTDSPAVFSVSDPTSREFDGYCFRFPRVDDLDVLVDDRAARKQIAEEMLLLGLPIPADPTGEQLEALAEQGYVTVVSLPLRSQDAYDEVSQQVTGIVGSEAPVLLFLDRVAQLQVHDGLDDHILTRSTKRLTGLDDARLVNLGSAGRYLLAERAVPARSLQRGLATSIERRLVDPKWKDWRGDATVSAAVRIDGEPVVGRRYTHLPMAKTAPSPARAHLNAPFYANISRTNADEDVPFNGLLMDELCRCCLSAANALSTRSERWAPAAVVDLLAWEPTQAERWTSAGRAVGVRMNTKLIPSCGPQGISWDSFDSVRRWNDLSQDRRHVVTARAVAEKGGAVLVRPDLGSDRLARLVSLGEAIGVDLEATENEVGRWVEAIAVDLAAQGFSARKWGTFYDDLDELDLDLEALAGRRILVSDSGELRSTDLKPQRRRGRAKITFFLPAEDEDAGPPDVPASLREDIAFMHRDLEWNLHDGHVRKRPGREYLERVDLVQEYRTAAVVTALRQIVERSKARAVHRDALRLAFRLFKLVPTERQRDFARIRFLLEGRSGSLVPAGEALFSPAWGTPSAELLEELIESAADRSAELSALRSRFLADPAPDQVAIGEWQAFLRAIGVADGLPLDTVNLSRQVLGRVAADREQLAERLGLRLDDGIRWARDGPGGFFRPETPYRFREPPVVLAGQRDHADLDDHAKLLYAKLVVRRLETAAATDLTSTLVKANNPGSEPQEIRSPFHAFVRLSPWLPTRRPGQAEEMVFGSPAATWHHEGRHDRPPVFASLLAPEVGRELSNGPALERMRNLGLRVWDDPDDAWLLVPELASIVDAGIRPAHEASVKNAYQTAWHHVVSEGQDDPFAERPDASVLVHRGSRLVARPLTDEEGTVLVPCRNRGAFDRFDLPGIDVFATDPGDGSDVTAIISEHLAAPVVRSDQLDTRISIDGEPISTADTVPLLTEARGWLAVFLLAAQRFNAGVFRPRTDRSTRETFERLQTTRVRFCATATIHTDLADIEIPIEPAHPVLVQDEVPVIIATGHSEGQDTSWSWVVVESLSRPFAELLREPQMAKGLAYSVVQIQRELGADPSDVVDSAIDNAVLADALDLTTTEVEEIRQAFQQALLATLERLYPLVQIAFGLDAATPFNPDRTQIQDTGDLLDAITGLTDLSTIWNKAPADIVSLVEVPTPWHELAEHFDIDFATLNSLLTELGSPYRPDHNPEGQRMEFEEYLGRHREGIAARLREAHLETFRERGDLARYTDLRTVPLDGDPSWVDTCWLQTPPMMRDHVIAWLDRLGIDSDLDRVTTLAPLETVQKENEDAVWQLAEEGAPSVRAWCAKHSVDVPDVWTTDQPGPGLVAIAEARGFLDFERLSRKQLIEWIDHAGSWPAGMPHTIDPADLALSATELAAAGEGRSRKPPPPTVKLGGRPVVADVESYPDLIRHLRHSISEDFLSTPRRSVDLREVDPDRRMPRNPPGPGTGSKPPRTPDQVNVFVGLAGEICALKWLQRQYRLNSDDCWVSGYRGIVRDDGTGDDSLGYDFRVRRGRQPDRYFEVKASSGPSNEFELTHNEAEFARTHTAQSIYTILLVTDVLDDDERKLTVLPNPYSVEGRARYRPTGRGVRYRFWRS